MKKVCFRGAGFRVFGVDTMGLRCIICGHGSYFLSPPVLCHGIMLGYLWPWLLFFGPSEFVPWYNAALFVAMAPRHQALKNRAMDLRCVNCGHGSCLSVPPNSCHGFTLCYLWPWLLSFGPSEFVPWYNAALFIIMVPGPKNLNTYSLHLQKSRIKGRSMTSLLYIWGSDPQI